MAFDKALPTNNTKIRNYPTVLNDNFAAIQTGDITFKTWQINFTDRDLVDGAPPPTQDPTRSDDTIILFSKQDAVNAETELFLLDDQNPANEIQLSQVGKLGSATTQIAAQDVSFATETSTYASTNMVAYWAVVNSGGSIVAQSGGLGSSRIIQGIYQITFDTPQSSVNYGIHLTCEMSILTDNVHLANPHTKTVNGFGVIMRNINNTNVDRAFTVTIYGGRS